MKVLGSRLGKEELRHIKGGQEKVCSATCKDNDGNNLGDLDNLTTCDGVLAKCQESWSNARQAACSCLDS